jgi:Tol biopolymer transport system component/predicted Ser/Thr protein kinase
VSVPPGTRLGSYEITSLLGSGGMGEVYRAKDLKLGRDVAIKVLREDLATDSDRLSRFEQEARSASALNHPNIIHIYDVGEQDGAHYIAMEYVEGKTLREIVGRGALPTKKLLGLATQIADGLAKAHSAGIVHRDLKPENLMVTGDGFVKILDFGLAKLMPEPSQSDPEMATMTKRTQEGVILGTVQYMSPEQAAGRPVDYRSDQFSLGSILYEMATGRLAFQKGTTPQTQAAIIEDEPEPITGVSPQIPAHVVVILGRCLAKDPEERYDSTRDLAREVKSVQEILRSEPIAAPETEATRPRQTWLVLAAVLAVSIVGVLVWWPFTERTVVAPDTPLQAIPLTSYEGIEREPALSPGGDQVAFVWNGAGDGFNHIYLKLIGGGDPLQLTKTPANDYSPAWSPDGREIAFLREVEGGHEVLSIPALGGPERRLTTSTASGLSEMGAVGLELDWSPDGQLLALVDTDSPTEHGAIFLLSKETGEKRRLTSPPDGFLIDSNPAFSPDGRTLAFVRRTAVGESDLYIQDLNESQPRQITLLGALFLYDMDWTADGKALVFSHGELGRTRLWRVSKSGGDPARLSFGENARQISISAADGIAFTQWLEDENIWRVGGPTAGERGPPSELIASTRADYLPQYSPDGTEIAFGSGRSGKWNIWVCDREGEGAYQLTHEDLAATPRWSPTGDRIAFHVYFEKKRADVHVVDLKGAFPRNVTSAPSVDGAPSWSADERWIYFNSSRTGRWELFKIPTDGGETIQLTKMGGMRPFEGPNKQYIYYGTDPLEGIWRIPVDGGEERPIVKRPVHPLNWCLWRQNIVYIIQEGKKGPSIEMFDLTTGETTDLASLGPHTQTSVGLTVSPDGQWILYTQVDVESDIMLVENFR